MALIALFAPIARSTNRSTVAALYPTILLLCVTSPRAPLPAHAPAAPMTPLIAPAALAAPGLPDAPFRKPFQAGGDCAASFCY
jgi:hypothetical protein